MQTQLIYVTVKAVKPLVVTPGPVVQYAFDLGDKWTSSPRYLAKQALKAHKQDQRNAARIVAKSMLDAAKRKEAEAHLAKCSALLAEAAVVPVVPVVKVVKAKRVKVAPVVPVVAPVKHRSMMEMLGCLEK